MKNHFKDSNFMDFIRHLRILFAFIWGKFIRHRSLTKTQDYWQQPDDGNNNPLQYVAQGQFKNPKAVARTKNLVNVIKNLNINEPKILEIGCNAGRNLNGLFDAKFHNLHGVEISSNALEAFETHFQNAFKSTQTYCGRAEQILSQFKDAEFDIVYTMAVLQHIHPESINDVTREMHRISKGYVITHEAEAYSSWRHFPRSYRVIFRRLGAKYIGRVNGARVFKKAH